MSQLYAGYSPDQIANGTTNRFFYGLRRTDNGELFLGKVDQMKKSDSVTINNPGDPTQNFPNYEEGEDFFEGRDAFHNLVYDNLNYEQFKWDDRNLFYYVNSEGELVIKINENHTYDAASSSDG